MGNCEARVQELKEDDVESYGWISREGSENESDHSSDEEEIEGVERTKVRKPSKKVQAVETEKAPTGPTEDTNNQASKGDLKLGKSISAGNPFPVEQTEPSNGPARKHNLSLNTKEVPSQRNSTSQRQRAISEDKKWSVGQDGTLVLQEVPPSPAKKENIIERNRNSVGNHRRISVDKKDSAANKASESIYKKEKEEKEKAHEKKKEALNKRKNIHYEDKRGGITYSNKNLLDIEKFIVPEILESKDPDTVIYEGSLLKYKPGNGFFWVERWCVLTRTEFRYYKKQYQAYCPDIKPLVSVPVAEFLAVFRVNLDLPYFSKKKGYFSSEQKRYEELYQFEIFNELTDYPYHQEILNKDGDENEGAKEQRASEFDVENLEGFKLWKNYEEEKRNKNNSPSKARKGYLMRPPMTNKNIKTHHNHNNSRDGLNRNSYNNSNPNSSTHQYSPPRLNPDGTLNLSPQKKPSPATKAVYKWHKEQADMISWTNREREWYYSEKRLLFAIPKLEEREKWIAVLNWVLDEHNLNSSRKL